MIARPEITRLDFEITRHLSILLGGELFLSSTVCNPCNKTTQLQHYVNKYNSYMNSKIPFIINHRKTWTAPRPKQPPPAKGRMVVIWPLPGPLPTKLRTCLIFWSLFHYMAVLAVLLLEHGHVASLGLIHSNPKGQASIQAALASDMLVCEAGKTNQWIPKQYSLWYVHCQLNILIEQIINWCTCLLYIALWSLVY